MAKYESRYKELTFFVDGVAHKFSNGSFVTEDKKAIEALDKLQSAKKVKTAEEPKELPKEEPKKEAPKTKKTRKASAKKAE